MHTIDDLHPIISRVRTDITAIKASSGASIWKRDQALTSERIQAHLSGKQLRGVCPIKEGESTTRLALLDLDSHKGETSWEDMLAAAQKLWDEATELGVHFEIFRSSGGKGIHLIAIWDEPQDAYSVRELMMDILLAASFHSGAGGVAKGEVEIFPKQSSVPVGGCGNQFILPYSPKGEPLTAPTQWKASNPARLREKPKPKPRSAMQYEAGSDKDEAAGAVQFIPCEDYHVWVEIGMALQDAFGDDGFEIWDSWSTGSAKYNAREMRRKWNSFRNTGITIATLFDKAMVNGWKREPVERPAKDTSAVDGFVKKAQAKAKQKEEEFDPLKLEGLIGDTVRWICKDALFPQPMLALLNALAFAGSTFGRQYATEFDTRSNIYLVGIADTGAGKDNSRKKIGKLAEAAGLGQFVGAHNIRSDTGMMRSLSNNPCQLLMLDEFGKLLQALTDKQAGPHHKAVIKAFMTLYSDSSGVYKHGDYANPKINEAIVIHNPNLCIYGTSTEKEYVKALNKDAVESGELNRIVAIKVDPVKRVRPQGIATMDDDLVSAWSSFAPAGSSLGVLLNSGTVPPEPTIVGWGKCDKIQWAIGEEQDSLGRANPETAPLWNRRHENILKIAMIFAIARNRSYPVFEEVDFNVAKRLVDRSVNYMCSLIGDNMPETPYEMQQQEIVSYLKKHPKGVDSTSFASRFRKIERKKREEIVTDMVALKSIRVEAQGDPTKPGPKKVRYFAA